MWPRASVVFFLYVAGVALVRPGIRPRMRAVTLCAAAAGLALSVLSASADGVLRIWILPPALLLTAYWTCGGLFVTPMVRVERALLAFDRALRIPAAVASLPGWLAGFLELAYAGVYPLVPIALVLHLHSSPAPSADRFWTVILVTDYVCFGMLPWLQTRPPRAIEPSPPWRSGLRRMNLEILGRGSIGVNTLPSGHAAEAMAAALLLSGAPWPIVAWMAFNALAISAAAVLGRYHYAADALAGWLTAAAVWSLR